MTLVRVTDGFGLEDGEVTGDKPVATRLFVAYPIQEEVITPTIGMAPPEHGYRAGPFSQHHCADLRPLQFDHTESPLYFETGETAFEGIEPQRDGSIALHIDTVGAVVVIQRHLASFVRGFTTAQEAVAYAQAQNGLLATLHEQWRDGAQEMHRHAEALLGRVVISTMPKSESAVQWKPSSFTPDGLGPEAPPDLYEVKWPEEEAPIRFSPETTIGQMQNYASHLLNALATGEKPTPLFVARLRALSSAVGVYQKRS